MVLRQKKEEEEKQKRAELDREKELKRIASFAAREIRQFWNNVEKVCAISLAFLNFFATSFCCRWLSTKPTVY